MTEEDIRRLRVIHMVVEVEEFATRECEEILTPLLPQTKISTLSTLYNHPF